MFECLECLAQLDLGTEVGYNALRSEEDRVQLEQWRLDIVLMNAIARAMVLLGHGQSNEAIEIAQQTLAKLEGADAHTKTGREALDQGLAVWFPGLLCV